MRALLVEDSRLARAEMRRLLAAHPDVEICGEAADAEEAERLIRSEEPDLVFLDIQLPGRNGFELLAGLDDAPAVIFCTAYSEFAVRAFERNSLDYLVKPVEPERLAQSLERARERAGAARVATHGSTHGSIRQILTADDRIFVKDGENCWFVPLSDVRLFEVEGSYTRLYFGSQRVLTPKTLNYLESRLDPQGFFRASRRHIVNLQWVNDIDPSVSGGLQLTLKDGSSVEVSRRQTQRFKEAMSL